MNRALAALLLTCILAAGGCAALTGGGGTLRIVAPELRLAEIDGGSPADYTLTIQRPIADKTRGTARVIVRSGHARLAFYPEVAWVDELPEMLQSLLLQAYTDTDQWTGVVRPGAAKARYSLGTEIRRFEAVDQGDGRLVVELQVQAGLLEVRSGRLVASRVFESRAPVAGNDADALTAAFESALGQLIGELIGWTLATAPDGDA
jgi:cholesterol transport system auxiliary component